MEEKKYNGWTNYETWAVALWIDNEQVRYRRWRADAVEAAFRAPYCQQVTDGIWTAKEAVRFLLADWLKAVITEAAPTEEPDVFSDLLSAALEAVNWEEIADHLLVDLPEAFK